eukprot:TRINITY_DN3888_c0_g1_i2.p1 TRINITY_DN3888_c0_g1~~TRINITY_DN3888_c0_g1_i2.p1  ORF type:complete len:877 (+),score=124.42 TRINITY_DN3888_c0_g1_i2:213-2633(+)
MSAALNKLKIPPGKKKFDLILKLRDHYQGSRVLAQGEDLSALLHDGATVVLKKAVQEQVETDSIRQGLKIAKEVLVPPERVRVEDVSGGAHTSDVENWPAKVANVEAAGVLIVGCSAEHNGRAAVLLGGRFYTGRKVYEYTDFGGGCDKSERNQPHLCAFREFAEEYFGLSDVGCVTHGRRTCPECQTDAQNLARQLWGAAKNSIVGGSPVVHTGHYASFVVPAEAVVPPLQHCGRLPCAAKGVSAIDILFSAAKRNPELTSVTLVSIDELLSVGVRVGYVQPLAVRSLDGVHRPSDIVVLRKCMVGCGGTSLMALSSRLSEFQRSAIHAAPVPKVPCTRTSRLPVVFDMETGDPDDVMTLLFLAAHAAVDLKAITVTPGSHFQVSLIRWLLREVGLSGVRVGAQDWPNNKRVPAPNGIFYSVFKQCEKELPTDDNDCEEASKVLLECCDMSTTLITGGPLTNLAAALSHDDFKLERWVAQGGFAGEGVVPSDLQMHGLKGLTPCGRYCRTTNFGSDPNATLCALRSTSIGRRVCVSKNVCHRTLYADGAHGWHAGVRVAACESDGRPARCKALKLMHKAMSKWLAKNPGGKKIHDPLALAVALDESVCTLVEVELGSFGPRRDCWGCWPCKGSRTWISVDYDEAKFRTTLLNDGFVPRPSTLGMENQTMAEKEETVVGRMSNREREVLKVAKKLREIRELEELVESLPVASRVLANVRDLLPERWQDSDDDGYSDAGDVLSAMQKVEGDKMEDAAGECSEAAVGAPESNSTELQQDLAEGRAIDHSGDPTRRWRQRGGRCGFKRI